MRWTLRSSAIRRRVRPLPRRYERALPPRAGRRVCVPRGRLEPQPCCLSPLDGESLELVDGDQAGAQGELDRLEVGEQTAEGGAADAERLRGLAAGVGERSTWLASRTTIRDGA